MIGCHYEEQSSSSFHVYDLLEIHFVVEIDSEKETESLVIISNDILNME